MVRYDRGHLLYARATAPCKLLSPPPPSIPSPQAPPAPRSGPPCPGVTLRSKASIFVQVRGKLQAGVMTARWGPFIIITNLNENSLIVLVQTTQINILYCILESVSS